MINNSTNPSEISVLICGDSFAADWTVKYPDGQGWPNLLSKDYKVKNIAQAGCSEYKILKQLQSENLHSYSHLILSHTSPNRIPVVTHPVHRGDLLHHSADLIYNDINFHAKTNPSLLPIVEYFEKYFDLDYAVYCHNLILEEIKKILDKYPHLKVIHISNLGLPGNICFAKDQSRNFNHLLSKHPGLHNHFDDYANQFIYKDLKVFLDE